MTKHWFLLRLVALSLTRRKSRVAIAFAAVVVGVAIVSALANVYYDIEQKMTRELRTYGANLVLAPASPEEQPYLSLADVSEIAGRFTPEQIVGYSPYLFGTVKIASHQAVLAGTDFSQIGRVSPYWKIDGTVPGQGRESALIGEALARKLGITTGYRVDLAGEGGQTRDVVVTGILRSGGKEDNFLFVDLDLAASLLDKAGMVNVAYFSIAARPAQLESMAQSLESMFPSMDAGLVKQISQAEGRVLVKVQSLVLLAVGMILLLTVLCLVITMMNIALERRREIGLRKALGGRDGDIILELVIEGAVLGLAGGILGWILGLPLAQAIGQSVFHAPIAVRLPVLPLAVVVATVLSALAAFAPAGFASRVQPAVVLRGE